MAYSNNCDKASVNNNNHNCYEDVSIYFQIYFHKLIYIEGSLSNSTSDQVYANIISFRFSSN